MSTLTKVAIAGSTGNLGQAILKQVVEAGFDVTVLTRSHSTHSFPQSVKVAEVDYESLDSLTNVLRGQDAVISTIATAALDRQLLLVEAAAKAGVKRFLPSEFGSDTLHPKTSQLPCYVDKIAVQNALKKEAQASGMTYTFVINGPFFDWGLRVGFIADVKRRTVPFWDGGDRVFSTTTLATIGRAVVGVLKHPEETKNRAVYVQEAAVSSKQILEIGKRATGSDDWKATPASLDDFVKKGWEELEKPQPDPAKFVMNFITASIWGREYGGKFEKLDNELLGIEEMDEEGIECLIKQLASE
ncbi:NAD(P)-binding protein [Xylaria sp. FL0043]|nr:NAD(P)-binding protein [Xylaria sp. FL0043]